MNDPRHPIWSFGRVFMAMLCLTVLLATNASHFDHTELTVLGGFFVAMVSGEAGLQWWQNRNK